MNIARSWLQLPLLCLLVAASPAPPAQAPTSKWIVNFDDAQCFASRAYGADHQRAMFVVKLSPLGNVVQLAILRPGYRKMASQVPLRIHLDESEPIKASLLVYGARDAGKPDTLAHLVNLPIETLTRMRKAGRIRFNAGALDMTMAPLQLQKVSDALKLCIDSLQKNWNITDKGIPTVKQRAQPQRPLRTYFSSADYPGIAIDNEQSGTTKLALLIDEKGAIADCTLEQTSGVASLDAQSCVILRKRAKFNPAIGMDDKPAKSMLSLPVTWQTGDAILRRP